MTRVLLVSVRFSEGRFHGTGDWPPAPARLFQALLAGAASGGSVAPEDRHALAWLESLASPTIVAPAARRGQAFRNYVPNNDLDAKGGDPANIAEIRVAKSIRPLLFDRSCPLLYLWEFEPAGAGEAPEAVAGLSRRLYQLGRGVDMAWADAEVLETGIAEARVAAHPGIVHRPSRGGGGNELACPVPGSLASLERRFTAFGRRLGEVKTGKKSSILFAQPPRPRFRQIAYDAPPVRLLYDLRDPQAGGAVPRFIAHPQQQVIALVERLRDRAAAMLSRVLPARTAEIERFLVGRGATDADKAGRIRILPLPSIGHAHAERSIRRVLVEVPPDCPLPEGDIDWAFTADSEDATDNSVARLVATEDRRMVRHYGIGTEPARRWRTITPAALPESAARRRIDPGRRREEAKDGAERLREERSAASAVHAALRHAGVSVPVAEVRVQREPFAARGLRAEQYAEGTRFSKHSLWHVEVVFATPCAGPIVVGDGRFVGLGLMAPERESLPAVVVYRFEPGTEPPLSARSAVLEALRRALMALDREVSGEAGTLFSGHERDGGPAADGSHRHVFLAADTTPDGRLLARLCAIRPDLADRSVKRSTVDVRRFAQVTQSLETLRAGAHGIFRFAASPVCAEPTDALFGISTCWRSLTPYEPARHPKRGDDAEAFVRTDLLAECHRRGLPVPERVAIDQVTKGPRGGITAHATLGFSTSVRGPVLLGRGSHKGSGVFGVADS